MENSGKDTVAMANALYVAAVNGNTEVITSSESSDEYLLTKTHQKNSIVHIALQNKSFSFANEALKRLPGLLCDENADGNNPLHIAAEVGNADFVRQLCERTTDHIPPLRMQNKDGNTPLHVAIIHANVDVANVIFENDPGVAGVVNGSMEAPLHLLIKHFAAEDENSKQTIKEKMRKVLNGSSNWGMSYSVASQEGLINLITSLLMKESNVSCWRDASGLTPLHRAALLNTAYRLEVIKQILCHCPPSVEVRDIFGKTILHYLINRIPSHQDGFDLFNENQFMYSIINYQDQHGDTPLHLAIIEKDFVMVRLLLDVEANLNLKNKDNLSAANLIQQSNILDDTRNPWREPIMENDVFVGLRDHSRMLRRNIDKNQDLFSLSKTNNQNNVVHVAIKYFRSTFAEKALMRYPPFMWEKNLDGNTPIHIAAEVGDPQFMKKQCDTLTDTSSLRLQNSKGNTPLHVALLHNNLDTARILVEKDPGLIDIVNSKMEAPLHLVFHDHHEDYQVNTVKRMIHQMINKEYKDVPEGRYLTHDPRCIKMVSMINLMLTKGSYVGCWHDANGLTPLHKAASVDTSYNLDIIRLILRHCPQSEEERDDFGRTILHHLVSRIKDYNEGYWFLKNTPEMRVLRNMQDQEGNTPLHLAVIKRDVVMWRLLTECYSTNVSIKNNEDLSAKTLMNQNNAFFQNEIEREDREAKMMTTEECVAAEYGDAFYFSERLKSEEESKFLYSSDSKGRNFMHKLFSIESRRLIIKDQFIDFIKHIKDGQRSRHVMIETDGNGDTPFHILARLEPDNIKINMAADRHVDRLDENNNLIEEVSKTDSLTLRPQRIQYKGYHRQPYSDYEFELKYLGETTFVEDLIKVFDNLAIEYCDESNVPWFVQNDEGNTPLHEAIVAKNFQVIPKLAELTRKKAASVNNRKETVCHLLASLTPFPPIADDVLDDLIENDTREERYFRDMDGLSPLIRAIQAGNVKFAVRLCFKREKLAEVTDPKGQTFWHLLVNLPSESVNFEEEKDKDKNKDKNTSFNESGELVWSQLKKKDKDENTPLHVAIKNLRFDLAKGFLSHVGPDTSDGTHKYNVSLLQIENKAGETPGHMIGALPYLPSDFEDFIWKDRAIIGTRSIWGIPSTQIKDYVNTMGVIAALLTTITFTAAFTVPGGLNQEKGTPLLMSSPAFQVFIISDVLAMCLSMLVLLSLLWIMATADKRKSVLLLDLSIILLLASFYTTLLTFMTGLYATTYQVKRWVTIVSLVPCSMLLLLMHKYLVMHVFVPAGKGILIITDMVYHFGSKAFRYAWMHLQCVLLPFHYANELRKKLLSRIKLCGPRSSEPSPELPMSST